jgi:hypothetical protein
MKAHTGVEGEKANAPDRADELFHAEFEKLIVD